MKKNWPDESWEDYKFWQTQKKNAEENQLDKKKIERNGEQSGIGKPEA